MLDRFVSLFFSIPGPWVVGAVFFLAAAETALFIGFVIPGELAVILGGVLASRAHVPLSGVIAAAVAGPILGDSIGYYIGRRYGENVSHGKVSQRRARARQWIKTKGAPAVFFGRFVAFLRSFIPAAAGAAKMPYRRFLLWNAAGGILWGTGSALLGYFGGQQFERVVRWAGRFGIILFVAATALLAGIFFFVKRARSRRGTK